MAKHMRMGTGCPNGHRVRAAPYAPKAIPVAAITVAANGSSEPSAKSRYVAIDTRPVIMTAIASPAVAQAFRRKRIVVFSENLISVLIAKNRITVNPFFGCFSPLSGGQLS